MATAETQAFPAEVVSPLTGTLADPSGGQLQSDATHRRYRSSVLMRVPDHGAYQSYARSIFYEVGRRYPRARDLLAAEPDNAMAHDCSIDINPAEAANFESTARRYSNFTPQWLKMDLTAIAERLAMGVAALGLYGGCDTATLRNGHGVRVVALGTLDSPQTASTSSVFIPRTVDAVGYDHVFAVLCAAANGCGASVSTDVVRLDPATNQPVLPAVAGPPFATACVEALRVLGANMEASGGGDLFAYAVTRGVHRAVSVVAHTDEGGFMRSLFRTDRFRVPYGGINQGLRHYPALPALASTQPQSIAAWVDAIALKTAAAVSHCDPLVPGPGGWYPTVFTSAAGEISPSGSVGAEPDDTDARAIGRQIAADLSRFAPIYMRALVQIFGLRTNSSIAEGHFCTAAARCLEQPGATDRHLRYKTVAPYFWIEPTSLLARDQFNTLCESEGYGAKVTPGGERTEPCFEQFSQLARGSNANHMTAAFKMRSARTSALVCALATDPAALASIRLYQFDSSSIILPGDQGVVTGDVQTKHAAAEPLSSYLWTRGQSCFPAPAEFINTQGNYGAKIKLVDWDDDFQATLVDLPDDGEMATTPILFRVSIPTGISAGQSNAGDRNVKRARTRAAIALSQAVVRARAVGLAVSPVMEVSDVPPMFAANAAPYRDTESAHHNVDPGQTTVSGEGAGRDDNRYTRGAPLGPTLHHQPIRAPRPVNQPGPPSQPLTATGPPPPHTPGPPPAPAELAPPVNPDPLPAPPAPALADQAAAAVAPAAPAN